MLYGGAAAQTWFESIRRGTGEDVLFICEGHISTGYQQAVFVCDPLLLCIRTRSEPTDFIFNFQAQKGTSWARGGAGIGIASCILYFSILCSTGMVYIICSF